MGEAAYRAAGWLARRLPAAACYAVSDAVALACFGLRRRTRLAVQANLRRVLASRPGPAPWSAGRAAWIVFQSFGRAVVDFLRLPAVSQAEIARRVTVDGEDALARPADGRSGLVIAAAHLGSWEVGGAYLAARGFAVRALVRPHAASGVDRFFRERRRARGVHGFGDQRAAGDLLAALRRGECVAVFADRRFRGRALGVRFFGCEAALPRGHVTLALRARAPLVVAAAVRTTGGFRLVCERVPLDDLPVSRAGVRAGVARAARVLERLIAAHPTQWHVFEPVWGPA